MLRIKGLSQTSIDLIVANNGGKPPKLVRVRAYIEQDGITYQWAHRLINDNPPYAYSTGIIPLTKEQEK